MAECSRKPKNTAENRKAGPKGQRFARHHTFRWFARPQLCLNLFHGDRLTRFFIGYGSFSGTSYAVLLLPISLNLNWKHPLAIYPSIHYTMQIYDRVTYRL